ncbi:hypothetical protein, partial [Rhizobium ecuadorense]|uniref:hypothetical protein n=1 Tax=Rhizobium ecuadorense TaxID=1671795 RepID=UPI001AEBFCA8
ADNVAVDPNEEFDFEPDIIIVLEHRDEKAYVVHAIAPVSGPISVHSFTSGEPTNPLRSLAFYRSDDRP